jgi:hypothetical protein
VPPHQERAGRHGGQNRRFQHFAQAQPSRCEADRAAAGAWLAAVASHTLLSLDFKKEPLYLPEPELPREREGQMELPL